MKKRIGISFTTTNFKHYWNWFSADDLRGDIELVELSFQKNNLVDIYSCDGFILTGGVDTVPTRYGGQAVYDNRPEVYQPERDAFEEIIFRHAMLHNLPLLGICRGMQLVNILSGGSLIQDLGAKNNTHRKEASDKKHAIRAEAGTVLSEISGTSEGIVNSAHHQAIDQNKIGENLQANAVAEDGTIEGLEFKNKSGKAFMLCVQWHPERMEDQAKNPFSQNIKEKFLEVIRTSAMPVLQIINPATEEIIATITEDTAATVEQKFKLLQQGQRAWAHVDTGNRIACIARFGELMEEQKTELAKTLTSETGKPLQQALNELNGARNRIQYFTDHAAKYLEEEWITTDGATKEKIVYEPLGIIANISAWNYPYLVGVNVFIPALLGGNAVFYKPSEYATLTGLHIQRILYRSGIPENCFQVAVGRGKVGGELLLLPLNGYYFTGSYKTGRAIAEKVAHKLVPCQLELGGKDPLYVMEDVEDIDATAAAVLEGVVYNAGQSCCAVERIYVHEKIYDRFTAAYADQLNKLTVGDPLDPSTGVGPLSRKEQVAFLMQQIRDAVDKGARVLAGGKAVYRKGYFIEPAVLADVDHSMNIMKEESFGPVVGIQKVKDDEEAAALMQDTEYGLTAAVYSKSYERAEAIMKKMNTGTVYWNCCDRVSASLPWSGRKHSGLGTTLSYQGIRAFVQPKSYHLRK